MAAWWQRNRTAVAGREWVGPAKNGITGWPGTTPSTGRSFGTTWKVFTASVLDPLSARCEIVELSHAREHVHELSALATQTGSPNATPATPLPLLATGRDLRLPARERDRQLAYFDINAHRMRYARFRQLIARNRYPKASVLIRVPSLVIDIVEALATIQDHDGSCPAAMWAAVATSRGMTSAAIGGLAAVNLPSISEDMFDSSVRVGMISNVSSTRSDL